MAFIYEQKVMFKHCDPAGIIFYPRYFEMMNDVVEEFFEAELSWAFSKMHETHGVPTVAISTQFKSPSRQGDVLNISMKIKNLGRTSMDLFTRASCHSELRFETTSTLVSTNREGRPTAWPETIRSSIEQLMEDQK